LKTVKSKPAMVSQIAFPCRVTECNTPKALLDALHGRYGREIADLLRVATASGGDLVEYFIDEDDETEKGDWN
jgi:hypothetical protein